MWRGVAGCWSGWGGSTGGAWCYHPTPGALQAKYGSVPWPDPSPPHHFTREKESYYDTYLMHLFLRKYHESNP